MNKQWNWARTSGGLLVLCLMGGFMLRRFEYSQVYHPDPHLYGSGADLGREFEDVSFRTSDGLDLNGWFFPADKNSARKHLAVLFCHGNAGNIGDRLDTCAALLTTGVNVFVFDYRGYGKSQGKPTEEGTYLDAQAAHEWLQRKGFAGSDIIAFGESLGGGVASELALRTQLGGIILQSTFTSIPDIGAELFPWLPVRWLATIIYDTCSRLPRIKLPVLVMHSRADDLIGFHHGQRNYDRANQPKIFAELKGAHNDAMADRPEFIGAIEGFLGLVERHRTAPTTPVEQPNPATAP